jgi:putative aldouronate transport system substrate-binding protein
LKKMASMCVSVLLTGSLLSACSSDETQATIDKKDNSTTVNTEGKLPIVKEPITLKVHIVRSPIGGDTDKQWFWKWAEKKTNIKFEVTTTDQAAWNTKKNLLFASGDLPDILLHNQLSTDDIVRFGQLEKQLLPLNKLIDDYAPHVKKAFKDYPEALASSTTPDGNIYTLPEITRFPKYHQRLWVNQKWLDNLGLKAPKNLDELYTVLKAFKEKDPNKNGKQDEIPFTGAWNSEMTERTFFLTAFGLNADVNPTVFLKGDKVALAEAEPVYGEYLKYMNKLYSEGLIDKNIFTQDQAKQRAITAQDLAGFYLDGAPFVGSPDNWKDYQSVTPLTSQWNDKLLWPVTPKVAPGQFAISKDSKYPEAAIQVANLYFNPDYNTMLWYGPREGTDDTLGYPGWTVKENGEFDYPKLAPGVTNFWDMQQYLNPLNGQVGLRGYEEDLSRVVGRPVQREEKERSWKASYDEHITPHQMLILPVLYFNPKDQERILELKTPMADYTKTMEAKFITGAEPLSKLDQYFETLKKQGTDEMLKIYQEAYDNYKKYLK